MIAFVILLAIAWAFEYIITPIIITIQGITQAFVDFIQLIVGAILLGVLLGIYYAITENK